MYQNVSGPSRPHQWLDLDLSDPLRYGQRTSGVSCCVVSCRPPGGWLWVLRDLKKDLHGSGLQCMNVCENGWMVTSSNRIEKCNINTIHLAFPFIWCWHVPWVLVGIQFWARQVNAAGTCYIHRVVPEQFVRRGRALCPAGGGICITINTSTQGSSAERCIVTRW